VKKIEIKPVKKDYSSDTTSYYNILGTAAEVVNTIHNGQENIVQFVASAENFDNPTLTQIEIEKLLGEGLFDR
jgi:hypothetical protein